MWKIAELPLPENIPLPDNLKAALMRLELDGEQTASVILLESGNSRTPLTARILATSGRRMTIACDVTPIPGTPVEVRWASYLVLAEILSVQEERRTLVLHIRHALNTNDLHEIRQKWV